MVSKEIKSELVVIGGGPGGYTTALRAADLGKQVTLIEKFNNLGGVCLNVGCIPSKFLLNIAKILNEFDIIKKNRFVSMNQYTIDHEKIILKKNAIINQLNNNLHYLFKKRNISILCGTAKFISKNAILVHENNNDNLIINFEHAVIAVGSRTKKFLSPNDSRIFYSTEALKLSKIDKNILILGGGIIGLEMATIYSSFGVDVTVIESSDQIIPSVDKDLSNILQKNMENKGIKFLLNTTISKIEPKIDEIIITINKNGNKYDSVNFKTILIAIGRDSNVDTISYENAEIEIDKYGFIKVDKQMRTNIPNIFAIGDVVGQPMLAHKAIAEGKIAAEVISGLEHISDNKCIVNVAYTDPEIAWVGINEKLAMSKSIHYKKSIFPWTANGRALSTMCQEGITKLLFCSNTNSIIGAGIVGKHAGDLISELALAIEMDCDAEDIALTIHPHPTLSESIVSASEMFIGTITDFYNK